MNQYYDKIMDLKEAEELKKVIAKWQTLSENIKQYPTDAPIILPDMLWVAKSGVGKTHLLRLISEYLDAQGNLMSFYGDVKFFEFILNYCSPDMHFTELERLIEEVKYAAGFRSEFKGIMRIDIDDWLTHFEEKHFISFMEYLSSNSDKWLIILSVSSDEEEKIHNLESFLSMYLRIEKITLSLPKTENLFEYIKRNLGAYGISLAEDAVELLYKTIEELRKNKYFDGFKSIKLMCQDIVYETYSKEYVENKVLCADDLKEFSAGSEYVKKTLKKIQKVNEIGFRLKKEETK